MTTVTFSNRRDQARIPFGTLVERGMLQPGQPLYFGRRGAAMATVLADGHLRYGDSVGSIHAIGHLIKGAPCNGWEYWYFLDPASGERVVLDHLRQTIRNDKTTVSGDVQARG